MHIEPITQGTWEAEIERLMVQGQPVEKVKKTQTQLTSWVWCHVAVFPAVCEAEIGGSRFKIGLGQKQ
jgi:hypothetical protein